MSHYETNCSQLDRKCKVDSLECRKITMKFVVWLCLTSLVFSVASASNSDFLDILSQAQKTAGDDPKASLKLLATIDGRFPSTEKGISFQKDLLKCEILADNDDPREALKISESYSKDYQTELGLKMSLCRSSGLEGIGESIKAETELLKILASSQKEGFREVEGQALLNIGQLLSFRNQFATALTHLSSAKEVFSSLKNTEKERITLNSIAILYGRMGEHEKAITYFEVGLAENKRLGKKRNVAVVLYNIGRRYEDLKNFDKALKYFSDSLKIHQEINNEKSIAVVERALGSLYNRMGKPEAALKHLSNALVTLEQKNILKSQAQLHLEFGKTYALMKRPKDALLSLEKAERINEKSFSQQMASAIYQERRLIYENSQQWQLAYESLTNLKNSSDSVLKMKADEKLNRTVALFDLEMLQKELANSQRIQDLQLLAMALGLVLFIVGLVFTFKQIRLAKQMRNLALTDVLTNIPNRRHVIEYGNQMLAICQRKELPVSVVILDIDHFKKINDTYGHAIGDEVIKKVAFIGRNSLRREDSIGRFGGEEFLAILPFTASKDAHDVADRIRLQIQKYDFSSIAKDLNVTVSVGVVTKDGSKNLVTLDQLIQDADEALYDVKQNGRNSVRLRLVA